MLGVFNWILRPFSKEKPTKELIVGFKEKFPNSCEACTYHRYEQWQGRIPQDQSVKPHKGCKEGNE